VSQAAGMVGMDTDQLDALARNIAHSADRIDAIRVTVGGRLHHTSWDGPDAHQARSDWDHRHAGALVRVAASLRERGGLLTAEAEAQRRASADDGGAAGPGALRPSPSRGTDWVTVDSIFGSEGILDKVGWPLGIVGLAAMLTNRANTIGRYTKAWDKAIAAGGNLLRYKQSPLLHLARKIPGLGALGSLESRFPMATKVSKGLGVITTGTHIWEMFSRSQQGDSQGALYSGGHAVASGLKLSKNPVSYLGGVAVELWTQAAEEAGNVHWDEGLANPLTPGNWDNIWAPALKETGAELIRRIPKIIS
jgi:hypothetical protein